MNVVITALSAPTRLNGVSRHGVNLVRSLLTLPKVSNIHFLAGDWQKEMFDSMLPRCAERLHVHWIHLREANFHRLFWYLREFPQIARQLQADVVHLTFPAPVPSGAFASPTVLSLHDLYPFDIPENFGSLRSLLARQTVAHCLRKVDAIACASASTRVQLIKWFPDQATKAVVIPNVVELLPPSLSDSGLEELKGRTFLLCVAQHRANKNLPLAIQVFARAVEKRILHVDSRLVIIGIPGPDTENILRQISCLQISNRVLLLSGLSEPSLRWCYDNCSVLLAPSSIEGFGLPVAEGILAGCRIVCSDIPAFREISGPTCRFVTGNEDLPDNYVRAIRDVLARPRPAGRSLPQFAPACVAEKYQALYENLICSRLRGFDMLRQPEALGETVNPVQSRPTRG